MSSQSPVLITVQLFGAFRSLHPTSEIQLNLTESQGPVTIARVKSELEKLLSRSGDSLDVKGLIQSSALADESRLLQSDEPVKPSSRLAILPPVCGG